MYIDRLIVFREQVWVRYGIDLEHRNRYEQAIKVRKDGAFG